MPTKPIHGVALLKSACRQESQSDPNGVCEGLSYLNGTERENGSRSSSLACSR